MKLPQDQWPNNEFLVDEKLVNKEKKVVTKTITNNVQLISKDPWYAKKSSYLLCLRGVAWLKKIHQQLFGQEEEYGTSYGLPKYARNQGS